MPGLGTERGRPRAWARGGDTRGLCSKHHQRKKALTKAITYHICSLILLPSSSMVLILKSIPERKLKKKRHIIVRPLPKLRLRRALPTCAGISGHGLWSIWLALGTWNPPQQMWTNPENFLLSQTGKLRLRGWTGAAWSEAGSCQANPGSSGAKALLSVLPQQAPSRVGPTEPFAGQRLTLPAPLALPALSPKRLLIHVGLQLSHTLFLLCGGPHPPHLSAWQTSLL